MFKYRNLISCPSDIKSYEILYRETHLLVKTPADYSSKILKVLTYIRKPLEDYIKKNPEFLYSLKPIEPNKEMPKIVEKMCKVSKEVGVGPMSAVAGTIAELLGEEMLKWIRKEKQREFLIIENGGDIFGYFDTPLTVGVYSGESSPFSGKVFIKISLIKQPIGICTSSGTVGHSLSFGKADSVTIISQSSSFSDSCATAVGNLVKSEKDLKEAIEFAKKFVKVLFVCITKGTKISFWSRTKDIEVVL